RLRRRPRQGRVVRHPGRAVRAGRGDPRLLLQRDGAAALVGFPPAARGRVPGAAAPGRGARALRRLSDGALTRMRPRVSLSQVTAFGWRFERDGAFYASRGVRAVGVSVRKLEAVGAARAATLVRDAGLAVSCVTSAGPFPLDDAPALDAAVEAARRQMAAAA